MTDINPDEILEALNDKMDRDADNIESPKLPIFLVDVQHPTAENNYTWYRLYKSGWVEQGGKIEQQSSSGAKQIIFLKEMADTNYMFYGSSVYESNAASDHQENTNELVSKNTTGVTKYIWVKWTSYYWEVKGMAA